VLEGICTFSFQRCAKLLSAEVVLLSLLPALYENSTHSLLNGSQASLVFWTQYTWCILNKRDKAGEKYCVPVGEDSSYKGSSCQLCNS